MNVTHKIFTQLVVTYLETYVEEILGDYHCGFRRGRYETDQSFSLRMILQKSYGYCLDIYYLCMQYNQAYDAILRKNPTNALNMLMLLCSHCALLQVSALQGPFAGSTDTCCEHGHQNVSRCI